MNYKHSNHFKKGYADIKIKRDIVEITDEAKKVLYGKNTSLSNLELLSYYANPEVYSNRHKTFKLNKKSGLDKTQAILSDNKKKDKSNWKVFKID